MIRLLPAVGQQELLAVYTDGFRVYETLEDDDAIDLDYFACGDGEYANNEVHINTLESHRGISKDKLTQYLRAFQLRRKLYRKPELDALKHALQATL
jgi:transposase-like protein